MKTMDLSGETPVRQDDHGRPLPAEPETPVAYLVAESDHYRGLDAHHGVFLTEAEAEQCLLRLAGGDLADRSALYIETVPLGAVLAPEQHTDWPVRDWADVAAKYRAS